MTEAERNPVRDLVVGAEEVPEFVPVRHKALDAYEATHHGLVFHKRTRDGPIPTPLSTFTARIVGEDVRDDGVETTRSFEIEGTVRDRASRFRLSAPEFTAMNWPMEKMGTGAILYPGVSARDHARAAIQSLSESVAERHIYTHTGWRTVDGQLVFLTATGAIGPNGLQPDVTVELAGGMSGYALPVPPSGPEIVAAVRASLGLLDVAPDVVTAPLLGTVYRVVLGPLDWSGHLLGPTGTFKTALAALAQQHFGGELDARHLPGSWSSTANALELQAFTLKDALFVVDDFAPRGGMVEQQQLHAKADRLFRAQGNRSARGRATADGSIRIPKPPRGGVISTGEDIPNGESLRSRLWIARISPGDVDRKRLTDAQDRANSGQYAAALSGYVCWLAPRMKDIQAALAHDAASIRDHFVIKGQHTRAPGVLADIALGWKYFLEYAVTIKAVTRQEWADYWQRVESALRRVAETQLEHQGEVEPTRRFLELINGSMVSGRAHVASGDGSQPANPAAWGWRSSGADGPEQLGGAAETWHAFGDRIGWLDGDNLYLHPQAAYAVAQRMARDIGDPLGVSLPTIKKRLQERGHLMVEVRGGQTHLASRRTVEGRRQYVLHLHATAVSFDDSGPTGPSGPEGGDCDTERAQSPAPRDLGLPARPVPFGTVARAKGGLSPEAANGMPKSADGKGPDGPHGPLSPEQRQLPLLDGDDECRDVSGGEWQEPMRELEL